MPRMPRHLRDLDLSQGDLSELLKALIPLIDIVVAAIGGFFVRTAWTWIRSFLLAQKTTEALHVQMVAKGMSQPR